MKPTLVLLACLSIAACSRQPSHDMATESAAEAAVELPEASLIKAPQSSGRGGAATRAVADASAPPSASQLVSDTLVQLDPRRRFIRTGAAEFRVEDVYRTSNAIEALAARHGGFTTRNDVQAELQATQYRSLGGGRRVELATFVTRGAVQVRVPSERASPFLRELLGQMQFLDARTFAATDAQFELLRQQLAQARAQQAQSALGAAAQAGGRLVDRVDAITAQTDAKSARDEATLQQLTFEDRVAFATLDLALYQTPRLRRTEMQDIATAIDAEGPPFWTRVGQSLHAGWNGLQAAVVGALALWPLWIGVGIAWLLAHAWRRRTRRAPHRQHENTVAVRPDRTDEGDAM